MTATGSDSRPPPSSRAGGGEVRRSGSGSRRASTAGGSPTRCSPRSSIVMGAARLLSARARDLLSLHGRRPVQRAREQVQPVDLPVHRARELQEHPHGARSSATSPGSSLIWTFVNVFFHFTIGLVLAVDAQPARSVPRRLPDAAARAVGGAVVHLGVRLALHLQQPVRVPRPVPDEARLGRSRRPSSATRPGRSSP